MKNLISLFTLLSLFLSATQLFAQEGNPDDSVSWNKSGSFNFGIANTAFSNWAAGGTNNVAISALSDGKISRKTTKSLWEMRWLMSFGMSRVGDKKQPFKKNDDQIIIGSDYSRKLNNHLSVSAFGEFRSQFASSYQYAINPATGIDEKGKLLSRMFAPAYLLTALGGKYTAKHFSVSVLPLTGKFTFVLDDSLSSRWSFGQTPGEKIRSELGTVINFNLAASPFENVLVKSNLNLFSAYPKFIREIDVNWEGMVVFKINKFLNVGFLMQLIYDQDILISKADGTKTRDVQFKHVLNFNLGYKFAENVKRLRKGL
jgi:hypothetical protein